MYSQDSRMQDAGLIRSQEFDTVFMGPSLAIHFRQSDIDRIVGGPLAEAVNEGFDLERAKLRAGRRAASAIRAGDLGDGRLDFRDAPEIDSNLLSSRRSLSAEMPRASASYLFSGAMARESLWILARSIPPIDRTVARLTNEAIFKFPIAVSTTSSVPVRISSRRDLQRQTALASFRYITDPVRSSYLEDGYDYDTMVRNFERDAIGLIENPDVEFDIYFPPYSILQFVAMRDASPGDAEDRLRFHRLCCRRLTQFPNVQPCTIFATSRTSPMISAIMAT